MDALANSESKKRHGTDRSAELKKQAVCFRIFDRIEEGIRMTSNHPLASNKWALILGEQNYIARDRVNERGCLCEMVDGHAYIFRAKIGYFTARNGLSIPVLQRPRHDHELDKVLVHVGFGLQGAQLGPLFEAKSGTNEKRGLFSGVTGGNLIARDKEEALVEMSNSDVLTIFYPEGSVTDVRFADLARFAYTGKRPGSLLAKDALHARIAYIDLQLKQVEQADKNVDNDKRTKTIDRWFHELAAMIRLTKNFPNFRQPIFDLIDTHVNDRLRGGVQKHLRETLDFVGDRSVHAWIEGTTNGRSVEKMFPGRKEYTGGGNHKKSERSLRDQQYRSSVKGTSGSTLNQHGTRDKHGKNRK